MSSRVTLRHGQDGAVPGDRDRGPGLYDLLALLILRRRMILFSMLAVIVLAAIVVLLMPNQYLSRASILPSGERDQGLGLQSLQRIALGASIDENSSELFPVILQSYTILDAVLAKTYRFSHNDRTVELRLSDYFGGDNQDRLRGSLAGITEIALAKRTGVIELSVVTTYPELSKAVLEEYLDQLEDYVIHKRRSRAGAYADYLSRQMDNEGAALTAAEDRLADFQNSNRNWASTSDSELLKELGRLQRDVTAGSAICLFLDKELQIARLDAQKDVPTIRILDPPSVPLLRHSPHRLRAVVLAGVLTFLVAVVITLGHGFFWGPGREDQYDAYEALRARAQQAFPRSTRTLQRLGRLAGPRISGASETADVTEHDRVSDSSDA